jgi:hypothetical protein
VAGLVNDDELRLTRIGGLRGAVNESASFGGPVLGGLLVAVLGPSPVLYADALSYLCAFALVGVLVRDTAHAATRDREDPSIRTGLRYVGQNRRLRRLLVGLAIMEIGWTAMVTTIPVLALHDGGASTAGWLLGAYGAGSVLGGLIATRAQNTGGPTMARSVLVVAVSSWVLLLPASIWVWALAIAMIGVGSGMFFPRFFSTVTTSTPPSLRALVLSTVHIAISMPGPIGFVAAGVLAQYSTFASRLLIVVAASIGGTVVAYAALTGNPLADATTEAAPAD